MVAQGKAEVPLLNKYLKDYSDIIFGKTQTVPKKTSVDKEQLYENMEGFRVLFDEKITFNPKVGKKLDTEFQSISLEELMKKGNR